MSSLYEKGALTYLEIAECLDFISPDQDYDTWARVGRALYAEFGDEEGFSLFDHWSSGGASYREKAVRAQWKAFRSNSRVTIASVIYLANLGGWALSRAASQRVDRAAQAQERARRAKEAKEKQKIAALARACGLAKIQQQFQQMPAVCTPSHYMQRKQIENAGQLLPLKKGCDAGGDYIAWPLHDCDGQFCGFERIYDAVCEQGKTAKKVSPHAMPAQGFAVLGNLAKAKRAFVVGGLADGVAVHLATGECVIVVVGEHNIPKIITQLKAFHAEKEFISAPDNDAAGLKAAKASPEVRWVVPQHAGEDWNDVFCHAGAAHVKTQLADVIGFQFHRLNQRQLNINLAEGQLHLLRSAKETGKTHTIKKWIEEHPNHKVLIISYRVSLCAALAKQCGCQFYADLVTKGSQNKFLKMAHRLVITPDSLWRIAKTKWDLVVVDEADQTVQHFLAATMKHRTMNLDVLADLLRTSHTQILADADLSDLTTDFLQKNGLNRGHYYMNAYRVRAHSTLYVYESRAHLEQQTLRWLAEGERQFVVSNSKNRINNLQQQLESVLGWRWGHDFASISSDNSNTKEVQTLIGEINERAPGLRALLGTPSIGTGLSIDKHNFSKTIGFFGSQTSTAAQAHQQLARARGVKEYHVWLDPRENHLETDPAEIKKMLLERPDRETCDFLGLADGEMQITNPAFEWLYCRVKALQNLSKNQFRQRFIAQATAEGYTIIFVNKDEGLAKTGRKWGTAAAKSIDELAKKNIAGCALLTDEQLKAAEYGEGDFSHLAVIKTQTYRALNLADYTGDDLAARLNELTFGEVKTGEVRAIKHLSVMALSADQAKQQDICNRRLATSRVDLKHYSKRRQHLQKMLAFAGLDENLNYDGSSWSRKAIDALRQKILKNKDALLMYSGMTVTEEQLAQPVRWFNNFCRRLDLPLKRQHLREGDKRLWLYSLDEAKLAEVRALVQLRNQGLEKRRRSAETAWSPPSLQRPKEKPVESLWTLPSRGLRSPFVQRMAAPWIAGEGGGKKV